MFLVAGDLYEMFVLYTGKHTTQRSTVGIWSEVRVYRAPVHKYIVHWQSTVQQLPTTGIWSVKTLMHEATDAHWYHMLIVHLLMVTIIALDKSFFCNDLGAKWLIHCVAWR